MSRSVSDLCNMISCKACCNYFKCCFILGTYEGLARTMYIYDRMFSDFPAKNIVYTPIHRIYVVLANPKHVYVSVYQGVRVGSACEVLLV